MTTAPTLAIGSIFTNGSTSTPANEAVSGSSITKEGLPGNTNDAEEDSEEEDDGDSEEEDDDNVIEKEFWWEMKKLYSAGDIMSDSPVKCDNPKCNLVACAQWHELPQLTQDKNEWNTCLDCQKGDGGFGGWPDEMPGDIDHISETHRVQMATHCSKESNWRKHKFTNLPFMDRGRRLYEGSM